jgi:elongation factor G
MSALKLKNINGRKPEEIARMRNMGIIAHIDAGKTTTSERILYIAGAQHRSGDVDAGNTTTDYDPEERKRRITIKAASVCCEWLGHSINLIDTPGHIDFTAEVQRALSVLDGVVVVFSAVDGVQAQSETVWRQADRFGVPRLCFVNKMDRLGADFANVVEEIQTRLGARALPVQMPVGSALEFSGVIDLVQLFQVRFVKEKDRVQLIETPIEAVLVAEAQLRRRELVAVLADLDATMAEHFLNDHEPSAAELQAALRRVCIKGQGCPVLCGSAQQYVGVHQLLDAVVGYLPSPLDRTVHGSDPDCRDRLIERHADAAEPYAGLAFKTLHDSFGALTMVRVYSGTVTRGQNVLNTRTGLHERIERIYRMQGADAVALDQAIAGEIVAIAGLRETVTGDTLCDPSAPILLEAPAFPEAVISMAVEPTTSAETEKLALALAKLTRDDPTFSHTYDAETGQLVISGMGELHLETIRTKLARDYHVCVNVGAPRVAYRETITVSAEAEGRQIKRNGGVGQYGVCTLVVEPFRNDEPDHLVFESAVVGGAIPKEYVPAIERGVRHAARTGVLGSGYPLIHVKVRVIDGDFHQQESSSLSFELAGFAAFKLAAVKAKPVLLEPVMMLEVVTPESSLGAIIGDLNSRRVEITDVQERGHLKTIRGRAPLSEMFAYSSVSRSLSSGRATFTLEPWDYRPVPRTKYDAILKK